METAQLSPPNCQHVYRYERMAPRMCANTHCACRTSDVNSKQAMYLHEAMQKTAAISCQHPDELCNCKALKT